MIDLNELRRLGEDQQWIGRWYDAGCETLMAERDGEHEEVAHPMPIGLVPYLVAVQPAAISELLDRLEAAEKDAAHQKALAESALRVAEGWERKCAALRAKITEMEQQEPIGTLHDDGCFVWRETAPHQSNYAGWKMALYALPGAQPEPSIPDGWQLVPIVSTHEMKEAGACAGAVYYAIAKDVWSAMLAVAPEAKP